MNQKYKIDSDVNDLKIQMIGIMKSNLEVNSSNCRSYCNIMKYPLVLMRIVGLFHRKSDKWFLKVYPLLICIILWLSFARLFSLFEFWYGGSDASDELILIVQRFGK
ncbi:hypothetical protein BpHYR1_005516 [Brachionus plicatilis]|uniref:Uncharacterized protein n=1 Tax=Brachionus plicatilis TaxID=10195 RepID=A0A3M7SEP2_BRAPC|nr:hypothetical protein BpHYR1_005516 [Brachionus plicatilis]